MKRYFSVLLIGLLSGLDAKAQDCNFDTEKKDKFTGEVVRISNQRIGGASLSVHWNVVLEQQGDKYFVSLKYLRNSAIQARFQQGDEFFLRLEDGNVVKVAADRDYNPTFTAANGGIITAISTRGEITVADLKMLAKSNLTDVKFTLGGNDYTQSKISERQARKVSDAAYCLYNLRSK